MNAVVPNPTAASPVAPPWSLGGGTPATVRRAWALAEARDRLRAADPVMRALVDAKPDLDPDVWRDTIPTDGLFETLVFQVVGQQISVTAMSDIYGRLCALFPSGRPEPAALAVMRPEMLRAIGFSARKSEYVLDLAQRAVAGELDGLYALPHEEARAQLVAIRGIGPWTADGALLIAFALPDVLVAGDLVMRKAVQRAYGLPAMPSEKEVLAMGERWRPYRTLAAAYLFDHWVPDLDFSKVPKPERRPKARKGGRDDG